MQLLSKYIYKSCFLLDFIDSYSSIGFITNFHCGNNSYYVYKQVDTLVPTDVPPPICMGCSFKR